MYQRTVQRIQNSQVSRCGNINIGMLRIATWNVYHGNLAASNDPYYQQPRLTQLEDRVNELVNYGNQNNIALIAFQEIPQLIWNNPNHPIFTNIANRGYQSITVNNEYPPRPNINAPAPASATTDGYLILYDRQRLTLIGNWQYFNPALFLQGLAQARPPVQLQFQISRTNTSFNFLTWHTEPQHAFASGYVAGAVNQLTQQQGNWIIAGDLNIYENELPQGVVNPHHLTHDSQTLDHIISSGNVIDSITQTVGLVQWGRFWSDVHYVLFGEVRFP